MKRVLLICYFAMIASLLNAQKFYFIYLQTESAVPFFIRMDDKLYSSTSSGYLILSKLVDSTYNFRLGFPGKNVDLDFTLSLNKKDHGYLIKDFGEKGWGLFDLQSLSILMSSSGMKSAALLENDSNTQVNGFTALLSKATDDPSLKQNAIFINVEEKKVEPVQAVQKEEKKPEVTEEVNDEKKQEVTGQPVTHTEEPKIQSANTNEQKPNVTPGDSIVKTGQVYKRSQVTKISGVATAEGFESVFIDEGQNGNKDTVRILIPFENKALKNNLELKTDSTKETKKFLDTPSDTMQQVDRPQPAKKEETKKWRIFTKDKNEPSADSGTATKKGRPEKLWPFGRSKTDTLQEKKCQSIADNDDFLKLRRKMAGKTNDDGMLSEAKKYFRTKCFTTEQIKNLSSMFLSNAGKYHFFDMAHDYVSDKENFSSLQSELKDEYYLNKFKAIPGN